MLDLQKEMYIVIGTAMDTIPVVPARHIVNEEMMK